jgi:cytochrome c
MMKNFLAPRRAAAMAGLIVALSATGVDAASATAGKGLVQRDCASCHAIEPGKPSPNPDAPTFPQVADETSATSYSLHVFLQSTHATMPNFIISSPEIDDIVAYIRSLKTNP